MFTTTRRTLPVLALLLAFWGLDARPAQAQTFTRAQVRLMLRIYLMQATALNDAIQQLSALPASQVQGSAVQSLLSQYQTALANVQYQINQLELLRVALDQAFAVDRLIQNLQTRLTQPQGHGRRHHHEQQQISALQLPTTIANLQAALANIQAQISSLQSTIVVP